MRNLPETLADELRAKAADLDRWANDLKADANNLQVQSLGRDASKEVRSAMRALNRAAALIGQMVQFEALPLFIGEITEATPEYWNNGQFRYWCPYCALWHYHQPPNPGEPSLRVSHCDEDSPLFRKQILLYLPKEKGRPMN